MEQNELIAFRRRILAGYAIVGFILALVYLTTRMDNLLDEIPPRIGVVFIVILGGACWLGATVALAVRTTADRVDPFAYPLALLKDLPLGVLGIAVTGAIAWGCTEAGLGRLMYVAGVAYGGWMFKRVISAPV